MNHTTVAGVVEMVIGVGLATSEVGGPHPFTATTRRLVRAATRYPAIILRTRPANTQTGMVMPTVVRTAGPCRVISYAARETGDTGPRPNALTHLQETPFHISYYPDIKLTSVVQQVLFSYKVGTLCVILTVVQGSTEVF